MALEAPPAFSIQHVQKVMSFILPPFPTACSYAFILLSVPTLLSRSLGSHSRCPLSPQPPPQPLTPASLTPLVLLHRYCLSFCSPWSIALTSGWRPCSSSPLPPCSTPADLIWQQIVLSHYGPLLFTPRNSSQCLTSKSKLLRTAPEPQPTATLGYHHGASPQPFVLWSPIPSPSKPFTGCPCTASVHRVLVPLSVLGALGLPCHFPSPFPS